MEVSIPINKFIQISDIIEYLSEKTTNPIIEIRYISEDDDDELFNSRGLQIIDNGSKENNKKAIKKFIKNLFLFNKNKDISLDFNENAICIADQKAHGWSEMLSFKFYLFHNIEFDIIEKYFNKYHG